MGVYSEKVRKQSFFFILFVGLEPFKLIKNPSMTVILKKPVPNEERDLNNHSFSYLLVDVNHLNYLKSGP